MKCAFLVLSGKIEPDPVELADPLDINATSARLPTQRACPTPTAGRPRAATACSPRTARSTEPHHRHGAHLPRRKPDSGLGNIRSSPGDPVRNVDFVLLVAQGLLTVIGCAVVYSASRTRLDDPYAFVTRQVVFAIVACVVMVFVMMVDYEWFKERGRVPLRVDDRLLLVLLLLMGIRAGPRPHLVRPRPAQLPAGRDGEVHDADRALCVPLRRAQ